ncbi:hypothetical protein BJ741DRAFT_695275 [Chytriomyces cf. hyalinus JEL632]|nr:hypothetical protein BJ741DRAFT_695275 [Chytriomyces cf. hyalinus JEL632]
MLKIADKICVGELRHNSNDIDIAIVEGSKRAQAFAHLDEANSTCALSLSLVSVSLPMRTWADFKGYFGQWKNMKFIIGTAYTWFALDVAWSGLSLNQSTVLNLINFNGPSKVAVNGTKITPPVDIADLFYQIAVGNLIIAFCGTVRAAGSVSL